MGRGGPIWAHSYPPFYAAQLGQAGAPLVLRSRGGEKGWVPRLAWDSISMTKRGEPTGLGVSLSCGRRWGMEAAGSKAMRHT